MQHAFHRNTLYSGTMSRHLGPWGLPLGAARRAVFAALGCVMVLLGIIGAFVPLMPTTIFLILAAWCFARSSPRLEAWLLDHPRFGPVLRRWREEGAIPRKAKWMACGGMAAGYALFLISAHPGLPLAALVAAALIGSAVYVVSRPEPRQAAEQAQGPAARK